MPKTPNFTVRTLMALREEVVTLVENAESARVLFDAIAKENGVMPIKPERKRRAA